MIYNSFITSVNENEIDALLEEARDRFEYNTIAEATAKVVAEHEENWTRFMKGIGISELTSIMEGEQVIYEGARIDAFFNKAHEIFEKVKAKLAEITKRFMANVDKLLPFNKNFVKKYGSTLKGMTIPSDFEFNGYEFSNLEAPIPYLSRMRSKDMKSIDLKNAEQIVSNKEQYSTAAAAGHILDLREDKETYAAALTEYFYKGKKEKSKLASIDTGKLVKIIEDTKELKSKARKSLNESVKAINKMIKDLKEAQNKHKKTVKDTDDIKGSNTITNAYSVVLGYYKSYSSCVLMAHGAYVGVLSKQNAQAKAICTKLLSASYKTSDKKEEKKSETKVNTEAFLGAIEFI